MLFNSIDFAIFLPIVFILYWVVRNENYRIRNIIIVIASYTFYGWWNWRFLVLILISTVVDFLIGLSLTASKDQIKRRRLLWISITVNIGILGIFKYFNFFVDNFISLFSVFGKSFSYDTLNLVLPVGISFYTFQTMTYTIDVYKKKDFIN